jgi:chromosome segregation ATPase
MFNWRSLLQRPIVLKSTFDAQRNRVQCLAADNHDLAERIAALVKHRERLEADLFASQGKVNSLSDRNDSLNREVIELRGKLTVAERQAKSLRTAKAVWDVLTTLDNTLEAHLESALKVVRDSKSRIGAAYEISPDPSPSARIPKPSAS